MEYPKEKSLDFPEILRKKGGLYEKGYKIIEQRHHIWKKKKNQLGYLVLCGSQSLWSFRVISFKDSGIYNTTKVNSMAKEKESNKKKFFQCEVCGHGYLDKETAIKCYLFCKKNATCSAKITKKAVYFPNLPTHLSDLDER